MGFQTGDFRTDCPWRRPAPGARRAAMALYGWQDPGWTFLFAVFAAMPFVFAAAFAPALLSLTPTVDMIAPVADARAIADGALSFRDAPAPAYSLLLLTADFFVDAPGRIHLVAKAIAALLVAYPLAYVAAARFPAFHAVALTAAMAAFVAAPFSGPAEIALGVFVIIAVTLFCAPADASADRARFEGGLTGLAMTALWLLNPVFTFAAFIVTAAAPFVMGRAGLVRYVAALAVFAALAIVLEIAAPGANLARIGASSSIFAGALSFTGESAFGLGGIAISTAVVLGLAAVFGGGENWRGWGAAAALLVVSVIAARLAGATATPLFLLAAGIAAFSVLSPFYDGVFRAHDRASVSVAIAAAALTLFWAAGLVIHSSGQFMLQARVAEEAPADIRAELGLVQPGGPTIAKWIEEGRFSTPEARDLFALAPVDQSAMLLEAAARARQIASHGLDVAILTASDSACVIAEKRACRAGGRQAADEASVVFVPRLDLDAKTAAAKGAAEALLYTEFRLVEQTALWEVWVRRGSSLPTEIAATVGAAVVN